MDCRIDSSFNLKVTNQGQRFCKLFAFFVHNFLSTETWYTFAPAPDSVA